MTDSTQQAPAAAGQGVERSEEELGELRRSWRSDPCWDIEDTPGFEAHRRELYAFRLACEAQWETERRAAAEAFAARVGLTANPTLAAYLESLERRIEALATPAGP